MHPELPDDLDWALLARSFAGEASEQDTLALERWIAAQPSRRALVAELRRVWDGTGSLAPSWNAEAALERIKSAQARARVLNLRAVSAAAPVVGRGRVTRLAWRVAAAVLLVAGAGAAWLSLRRPTGDVPMAEVTTRRGQLATVRLSDGSEVRLAPASRLRFPKAYGGRRRDVYLDGAALFTVTHDSRRSFTVHTASAVATDLGTRFVVQAYLDDPAVQVVVAEGAVALAPVPTRVASADRVYLVLRPGDLGRVTMHGDLEARHAVAVEAYTSWVEGRLAFRDAPLGEAVAQLSRWYDLDITIGDSALAARRLTASFSGESAADMLRVLRLTLELRYKQVGRSVSLYSHSKKWAQ